MLALFIVLLINIQTAVAKTYEIEVHGMTCAFCVDSLQRKLTDMPSVSKVQVSLKNKKVRLETEGDAPSIDTLKQAVLDSGFTPVKITVLNDENNPQ
ncbi:heavy-metal-associated domain-containing protein [Photobacterium sp. CAU 1568]|uniref:Heavy-metal-associated domain-containing protein n=2 Tax=Photobacterium arenosum TaxID=2774143 RepID=A0ABR9BN03_9GAMM|nr:heavy-metal-associated domain-containing protein [Photobacterium arenosum]